MKGITFGNYHSFRDFRLILSPNNAIGAPTPKYELIEIPGGDGMLDFTEAFGEVKYNNRSLSFEFSTMVPQAEFMTLFSRVQNALHGQKLKIVLDDDPDCYYIGRLTVSEWKADRLIGKLTIDCNCEPFKYHIASQSVSLTGRNLINLDAGIITDEGVWVKNTTGYTFTRRTGTGGSFVHWIVPVRKGQQYTFSANYTLTTRLLYVYKDRLYGDLVAKSQSGQPCTFVAEKSGLYVFGIYVTSQATEGTFTNIMLQEGGTVGTYVAYDKTSREVTAVFSNTRKSAVPTAYASGSMEVQNASASVAQKLSQGSNSLDSFVFRQGETSLVFKGNGSVVIEWLERGL